MYPVNVLYTSFILSVRHLQICYVLRTCMAWSCFYSKSFIILNASNNPYTCCSHMLHLLCIFYTKHLQNIRWTSLPSFIRCLFRYLHYYYLIDTIWSKKKMNQVFHKINVNTNMATVWKLCNGRRKDIMKRRVEFCVDMQGNKPFLTFGLSNLYTETPIKLLFVFIASV